jgi:hypothetical protein
MSLILFFSLGYLIGATSALILIGILYASRLGNGRAIEVADSRT